MEIEKIELIGLVLPAKTTNENGQSGIDCGNLWQKFENERYLEKVSDRLSDEIFAVYYNYEGNQTKPFSYFIGCKVKPGTKVPDGMDSFVIQNGKYQKKTAKGEIPHCITEAWTGIWNSDIKRAYKIDFEVYDARSKDWSNGEVDIFVSVLN
ncbi:MAG: effector binding domain-containing protein [Chitinophagaceae bacterium]|nr:effector binding domain-containing protein [Chitinophagaceae bacterium]